jgi:hypothetical protein
MAAGRCGPDRSARTDPSAQGRPARRLLQSGTRGTSPHQQAGAEVPRPRRSLVARLAAEPVEADRGHGTLRAQAATGDDGRQPSPHQGERPGGASRHALYRRHAPPAPAPLSPPCLRLDHRCRQPETDRAMEPVDTDISCALASQAAHRFRHRRLRLRQARRLAESMPPAWIFVPAARHPASATELRARLARMLKTRSASPTATLSALSSVATKGE